MGTQHLRLTGYLRRLLSYFSADWLQMFLDLSTMLTQWIAWKTDGLYEILTYESTLDLADPQGKLATVRKHQRIRFQQNDVPAFQDIVYGDGQIFRHYKVSPGVAVDRYRDGDRWHVLISMLVVFILLLGMFLESTVIVLLLTPILVPIVVKAGIDPVHFGLVMMTATTLGSMTPPVGVAMYTVCGLLDTPMDEYAREALPLIAVVVALIFTMAFVPQIVMFLPDLLM